VSRIGIKPITIPEGIEVLFDTYLGRKRVIVRSTKNDNKLTYSLQDFIKIDILDRVLSVSIDESKFRNRRDRKDFKAFHGTTRQIIQNFIEGLEKGFKKELELVGIGYKTRTEGNTLVLDFGFSNDIKVPIPNELEVKASDNKIEITGYDKVEVGNFAAIVKGLQPANVYTGKGVRYLGEKPRRKKITKVQQ